jgi:cytochrome c-type biogenesis protein CcmH/NrfG
MARRFWIKFGGRCIVCRSKNANGALEMSRSFLLAACSAFLFSAPAHPVSAPEELFQRGEALLIKKQFAEVIKLLGEVEAEGEQEIRLRLTLGRAYQGLGLAQEALIQFSEILRHHPNHFEAHLGRAEALIGLGDGKKAAGNAQLATALEPNDPRGWVILGRALEHPTVQKYAEAGEAFRKAIELQGDNREGVLGLARALNYQKKVEEAAGLLEKWHAAHPEDIQAELKLAEAYFALKKLEPAEKMVRGILKREPDNQDAQRLLEGISFRRGFRLWVLVIAGVVVPFFFILTRLLRRGRRPKIKG